MFTKSYFALLVGVIVTLLTGLLGDREWVLEKQKHEQELRDRVMLELTRYRAALEGELNASLYLTNGLIAYVETHSTLEPADAEVMLKTLYEQGRSIRNIGLAPGNRLTYLFPRQGNEKAIGLYYPDLPDQWPAVQRAIAERKPRLAGPVQLKQGGLGFIYRVPVFIGAKGQYWGLLSMVIDARELYDRVGIAPQVGELKLAIRGKDGLGADGATFLGDPALFRSDAIKAMVSMPGGEWQIAAIPVEGWGGGDRQFRFYRYAIWLVTAALGGLAYYALANVAQRLRIEQTVKEARDELHEAQRLAMIGSWALDLSDNQLKWSPEIYRIFELDPGRPQITYDSFLNAIHPEDRELVNRAYQASVANRTPYDISHRLLFADGRVKHIRERCETVYADDGTPILSRGTVQDITQLHTAEEALRLSEERWKFALEGSGAGVWDWNLETGELYLSAQELKILGYEGEEATHTNIVLWEERQHPEDRLLRKAALESYFSGKAPLYSCEFRTRGRDGAWRWLSARGMVVSRSPVGRPLRMIGTHTDITERKLGEAEIARLSQMNELLLNSAGEGIYGVDLEGRCTFVNPAALAMLGFDKEEVLNGKPHDLFHHHHADGSGFRQEDCMIFFTLKDGLPRKAEDTFIRKSGEVFPVQINVTPMHDGDRFVGAEVLFQDISQRKAMEQELIRLATVDPLTGAANRRRFLEQLEMELARIKRFGKPASFLMVDIDHFKSINDTYGHATGDQVLQRFAELTMQRLRRIDLFGRLGGEEFGILLPGTEAANAWQFADRFRKYIADTPCETGHGPINFTISIGVAEFDPEDDAPDNIMVRADVALYRAKEGGRNRVEAS